MTSTCLEQITQFNVTAVRLPFVIEITVMHLLWVTCIQVHVAVISTHNRSFLWLMDWIETFGAQEENGKHYSRLWCTGCWVQTKNRIKKTKKESVFSPSHLLASSALFRSLSGRASSQSSIVLISFPLLKKERIHSHTSKWIRVHCFKKILWKRASTCTLWVLGIASHRSTVLSASAPSHRSLFLSRTVWNIKTSADYIST